MPIGGGELAVLSPYPFMKALLALLTASFVLLMFSLASDDSAAAPRTPRVECSAPHALRLHRFEDGSARLECGTQTLLRISVPG